MIIAQKIYRKQRSSDSLAWAKEHIDEAPDGAVFLADFLDKARGRQTRQWVFYEGQQAVTLLLKPKIFIDPVRPACFAEATLSVGGKVETILEPFTEVQDKFRRERVVENHESNGGVRFNYLSMALSLGVFEPIKKYGVGLKWPNDFMHEGKKLGGMLCELIWKGDQPYAVIVGFALNINNIFDQTDPLYPIATSLSTITQTKHDMQSLLDALFVSLDHWYHRWLNQDFEAIYQAWKAQQYYLGKKISVHTIEGQPISGQVLDFLANGDLLMQTEDGQHRTLPFYMVQEVLFN